MGSKTYEDYLKAVLEITADVKDIHLPKFKQSAEVTFRSGADDWNKSPAQWDGLNKHRQTHEKLVVRTVDKRIPVLEHRLGFFRIAPPKTAPHFQ